MVYSSGPIRRLELTVAPNITRSPESFETSMISARATDLEHLDAASIMGLLLLGRVYSAFSRRSPWSRAVEIS